MSVTDGGAILTWGPGSSGDSDDDEVRKLATIPSVQFEIYYKEVCASADIKFGILMNKCVKVGVNSSSSSVFESDHVSRKLL